MLRGALLGVGHVAVHGHLPGWAKRSGATIAAAADVRDENRPAFRAAFPSGRWYADAAELLASETLDFVDVCAPPALHASLVRAALERSLHVLCEKPLVLSPSELPPLAARAGVADRALVTVHNWKHAAALEKTTELVRSGAIGAVVSCRWETLRTRPAAAAGGASNWRAGGVDSGGGVLVDHGWHALYVLSQWLPEPPRSVRARLEKRRSPDLRAEDTAEVALEADGARAEVFLTWAAEERANRVRVRGEAGEIRLDGGRLVLERPGRAAEEWSFPSLAEGSHHPDWFAGVLREFLGEAEDPAARGRNLVEAARCVALIESARESHARGGEAVAAGETP